MARKSNGLVRLCSLLRDARLQDAASACTRVELGAYSTIASRAPTSSVLYALLRQPANSSAFEARHAGRTRAFVQLQPVSLRGFASAPKDPVFSRPDVLRQRIAAQQKTSASQGTYLVALIVGMVGLTYASVPLYRLFCQATGFGGTVQQGSTVEGKLRQRASQRDEALEAAAAQREITVSFNADTADGMPWRFVPTQREVKVRPGQSTLAFYTASNGSDKAITGVSTYNVTPQKAGYYFNKIQCFCFEEQKLRPGEQVDMPVFFYIDPEFATDPRLKGVDHLTLSYTFFKVDEENETPAEALSRIMAEHPEQQSGMAVPAHASR